MHQPGDGAVAGREPALDGLRAVAVGLVLLFHGGVPWMSGGYLGVSLFFTLSGFLITRLLLDELAATGTIRLGSFYARRARRLLPASLLCLAGVVVAARAGEFDGFDHLRRDVLGAVAQVYNWVQLGGGSSYGDLLSNSAGIHSPLGHYWSLAIEEQFYWLWPVVLIAGAHWAARRYSGSGGRRRAVTRLIVGAAVATSIVAPLIAQVWGRDAAYWATPARAAEILLGAAAAALHGAGRLQRVPTWMAPLGLAAIVGLAVVLPADHGFAYRGGLVVVGLISATVLLALRRPSRTGLMLSWRPVVAVGAVSYGLYLFHWPVFVVLDEARTGLDGAALFACRIGVTAAVTVASYWIVEQPVRRATWRPARTFVVVAVASTVALAAVAAAPAATGEYWTTDPDAAAAAAIRPTGSPIPLVPVPPSSSSDSPSAPAATGVVAADGSAVPSGEQPATVPATTAPSAPATTAPPAPSRPVRILVVGDSTAGATGGGLIAWAAENPTVAQVSLLASGKCGMVRGGVAASDSGDDAFVAACNELVGTRLPAEVATLQPDVVAIFVAARDSQPREWDPAEGVLTPTDPRYAARIEHDYRATADVILAGAPDAVVVWVRPPTINPFWKDTHGIFLDPDGHAVVDSIAAAQGVADPQHVAVVDLRAWIESAGYAERQDMRPDGIHFTPEAARQVAAEWLGAELVAAALR